MSFIYHIHNYTEYNEEWTVFSAFNPSKWSSGQPTLRRPGSSWGFGALLKGLTSVVDNFCRSCDSNPQPRVTSPTLYPFEPRLPRLPRQCIYLLMATSSRIMHDVTKLKSSQTGFSDWFHFTQMASTVTRSQSNRAPLKCGRTGDLHHGCAADKSAATALSYYVNMD